MGTADPEGSALALLCVPRCNSRPRLGTAGWPHAWGSAAPPRRQEASVSPTAAEGHACAKPEHLGESGAVRRRRATAMVDSGSRGSRDSKAPGHKTENDLWKDREPREPNAHRRICFCWGLWGRACVLVRVRLRPWPFGLKQVAGPQRVRRARWRRLAVATAASDGAVALAAAVRATVDIGAPRRVAATAAAVAAVPFGANRCPPPAAKGSVGHRSVDGSMEVAPGHRLAGASPPPQAAARCKPRARPRRRPHGLAIHDVGGSGAGAGVDTASLAQVDHLPRAPRVEAAQRRSCSNGSVRLHPPQLGGPPGRAPSAPLRRLRSRTPE